MKRTLQVVGVLLLVVGVGAAWYLRPIAPIATGYAALITCGGHFVSERPITAVQDDLPPNPLVPFLRTSVDGEAGTVTTTLLGLSASTARYAEGAGCVLGTEAPRPVEVVPAAAPLQVDPDEAVAAAIAGAFDEPDPGALRNTRAVVVLHDGRVVAEQYAEGFGADRPLLGWSMGKSIANAMVGRLVQDGALTLDDDELLPSWSDDERADITLADLLRMSSGLAFEEVYDPGTDATEMLFTPRDTGAYAAGKELVAPPGEVFNYSSGTTNILCDVAVEAADGDASLARDLVFAPLGMSSAVMGQDADGGLVCSSFPYATARDWARFGQWFLQDGAWDGEQLLPEDWVSWSTTPVTSSTDDEPYGAQWWLNEDADGDVRMPRVPTDVFWASGNEGQHVVVLPSQDLVVVRLGLTQDTSGIEWGLEDLLVDVIEATDG